MPGCVFTATVCMINSVISILNNFLFDSCCTTEKSQHVNKFTMCLKGQFVNFFNIYAKKYLLVKTENDT